MKLGRAPALISWGRSTVVGALASGENRVGAAQVIRSMRDSAQVTSPGAINSMIAAMSTRPTRPNRQNRSTCSRMSVPIALTPPPPCEPVHMRCAPMRRTRAHCAANPISPSQAGGYAGGWVPDSGKKSNDNNAGRRPDELRNQHRGHVSAGGASMSAASSRAPSRPTCRSSSPPSSSWSSTRKLRAYWASKFRPRCSRSPMR